MKFCQLAHAQQERRDVFESDTHCTTFTGRSGRAPSATGVAAASPGTIRLVAKYGRDLCQVTWIDLLRWQITTCSGKKR